MGMLDVIAEDNRIFGRTEGKAEGKEEKAIEMALLMLKHNEPIEKIILYTGLTRKAIEEINQETDW